MRKILLTLVGLSTFVAFGQLSGIKTIPTDYPSIAAFVTDLNTVGVGPGGVTLDIPSGYTETAPAGGYLITATGTAANPIVIHGIGGLPKPIITASGALTSGALNDGIIKLVGSDYVTLAGLELRENAGNTTTTAGSNNMTEWGIALVYNSVTDGCQNVTIQNNTISLGSTYQNAFGIYSNSTHALGSPTTGATATTGNNNNLVIKSNTISNVNIGIAVIGPTAAVDHASGLVIGGVGEGNTINFGLTATFSGFVNVSGTVNGILIRNTKNVTCTHNSLTSFGTVTSGTLNGIQIQASSNTPTGTFNQVVSFNTFNLVSGAAAGTVVGITQPSGSASATSTFDMSNNQFNGFGHAAASPTGSATMLSTASTHFTTTINNNSFNNLSLSTTGSVTFVSHSFSIPTGGSSTASNNNIVTQFVKTGAGGTVTGFTTSSSSPNGAFYTLSNNNFSNINVTGGTTITFINNSDGAGTSCSKTITGNTLSNVVGGTAAITGINISYWGGATSTMSNNTFSNISGQGAITGINLTSSFGGTVATTIQGNTISSLSSTGTGSTVTGINSSNIASNISISGNTIHTLSSTGASLVAGITIPGASSTFVNANRIYGLSTSNASGTVFGISLTGGAAVYASNNVISGLTAPSANGNDVIRGISVTSTTASTVYGVYYNSVYLNASSSGTNFGTSGIFHTVNATATTAALDMRNNIIINESTPAGTGLTVAFRRSGVALNNFASTSNKNMLYAGAPSATHLVMYDGTTSYQTILSYQAAVTPREVNSFSGESPFAGAGYGTAGNFFISLTGSSSDFLRPVAGIVTQAESGASVISTPPISTDFTGTSRSSTPDLGAYEFSGTTPAPVITLNSVTPPTTAQCTATPRVVSVTITTASGTITGATIGYAVNGVPQANIPMTNTSGNIWEGTIPTPTPANATISWGVAASNSIGINGSFTGTPYADEPLFGFTSAASASSTTVCSGSPTSLSVIMNNPAASTLYNTPSITNPTTDEDIRTVRITQGAATLLNNTSTLNTLNGTIGVPTGTAGSYSNYTSYTPTALTAGQNYTLFVASIDGASSYFTNYATAFIDYNRDGDFADAGESIIPSTGVLLNASPDNGNDSISVSFTVPAGALNGLTRMRVVVTETGQTNAAGSTNNGFGEFEDYAISLSGGSQGTTANITSVTWMDGATTVGTGNPLVVNPTAATTYSSVITALGCTLSPSATVTVNINPLPSAPTATNSAQCGTQVPTASVASTSGLPTPTFVWYSAASGGTVMQSSTSTTYTSNVASTTTFYVSELNSVTGCESARTPVTVTVSSADGIQASIDNATICIGSSANLSVVNTNPTPLQSYSYTWTNAQTGSGLVSQVGANIMVTPTQPGTYTYDVSGVDGGCNAVSSVNLTVNPYTATLTPINITCNGANNGSFSVASETCGTASSYSVDGGAFGPIPTNLTPGAHNVIVQNTGGFQTGTIVVNITEPAAIQAPLGISNVAVCQNAGTATLTVPVTATLTTTATFGLAAQPAVIGTSAIPTTTAANPNVIATATLPALPAGATITNVTFTMNGLSPIANSWANDVYFGFSGAYAANYNNGNGAPGSATPFNFTRVYTGTYNPAGGTVSLHYYDRYDDVVGDECIFPIGGSVGTLTVTYTVNNASSVNWYSAATGGTLEGTGTPFQTVGSTVLPNTATPGTYTFYAEGTNGTCISATRTPVTVTVNPNPTVNAGTDFAVCSGSTATLTGTGTATGYTWNNGVTNGVAFTPSATTTYTVTGTDANGCQNTDQVVVTVNALPTVNAGIDQTVCTGTSVTLAGSGATSYTWNNGVTDNTPFSATATTTYTVTGTDGNGCQNTDQVVVTVNALPTVNAGVDQSVCTGNSATLTGTGTATAYAWDNGVTDGVAFTPVATTTYTVTGTDANGCQNTDQVTVNVNALPSVSAGLDQTVCSGDAVTLAGSGATSYAWDNGVTDNTSFAATATTTYTVTGTDANGCTNTDQVTVTVNALPAVVANATQTTVCTGTDVTFNGSGATSYTWDNGVTDNVPFTVTATTTYTVTGIDGNGCSNTGQVTVNANALPTVDAGADQAVCDGGAVTLTGTGTATGYAWDNGVTDGVAFTPLATTTYTVTGTDANGCTNTDQVTVNVNALPSVNAGTDQTVCAGTLITLAGSGATSYAWDNGVTDNTPFAATTTTTYTVTGTDANGCTDTDQVTVTVNAVPTATATDNGDATITASAGTTYQWINCTSGLAIAGATSQTFAPTANGSYAVVITNASGCSDTSSCVTINNVSIKEATAEYISVYPNPTHDNVTITMTANEANVIVIDGQGKTLKTLNVKNGEKVSLEEYATGVYFLNITTEFGTQLVKIAKN